MPGCENVCWYVVESPLLISQTQLDNLKYPNLASNARDTGLGVTTYTTMYFWYGAFAPPVTPKPTPPTPPNATAIAIEAISEL